MLNAIVRSRLALLACLAFGACTTAPMPTGGHALTAEPVIRNSWKTDRRASGSGRSSLRAIGTASRVVSAQEMDA
jgi:hypothetical protein